MDNTIYKYVDYRAFLSDWFESAKKAQSCMSYRYLAKKIGVDAAYISRTFHGAKHFTRESLSRFQPLLKLSEKERDYLFALFEYNRMRGREKREACLEKLVSLQEGEAKILTPVEYRYWMLWFIPVVRLTLLTYDFTGDFAELARRLVPRITEKQARDAVRILEELQLVRRNEKGVYEVLDRHISTGDKWVSGAIREYQMKMMDLAQDSIRNRPPELREISTLALAIPRGEFEALQKKVRDFRAGIAKWALSLGESDCVIQVNLACFPVSLSEKDV